MKFKRIEIVEFNALRQIASAFDEASRKNSDAWFYRGHTNSQWLLESKFERYCKRYNPSKSACKIEEDILREFDCLNRKSPQYISGDIDRLQKMIFLQHNGCATRLLDMTSDFFTACFFALHDIGLSPQEQTCCIWCFKEQKLLNSIRNSNCETFYENIANFDVKSGEGDKLIGTDYSDKEGVLLIGNLIQ